MSSAVSKTPGTLNDPLETLACGRPVVVVDRDAADSTAVLVLAADHAASQALQHVSRLAGGSSYLALSDERCEILGLELLAGPDASDGVPPLTMPIIASDGTANGIGIHDRAHTIGVAIDPRKGRADLRHGRHVLPLRARAGGVLERARHTEAAVDLARLAGLTPAAVIVEIVDDDGHAVEGADASSFADREDLPILTIAEIVAHRRLTERLVERVAAAQLATRGGSYLAVGYLDRSNGAEHMAMVCGDVSDTPDVPVYVHAACWEGDIFLSRRCGCSIRLQEAEVEIQSAGTGVIIHLADGVSFEHRVRSPAEQERNHTVAAQILVDLGVGSLRLLSEDRRPMPELESYGLDVAA